jgi:hypothetical protein
MKELPYQLTKEEQAIVQRRLESFQTAQAAVLQARDRMLQERAALQDVLAAIVGQYDDQVQLDPDLMVLSRIGGS